VSRWLCQPSLAKRAQAGGEGRIRTSEAAGATDLQSAAFDRSATSPALTERRPRRQTRAVLHESGRSLVVLGIRLFLGAYPQKPGPALTGAGGGIRTPDRLITNQLLYQPELRQPDKACRIARPVPVWQYWPGSGPPPARFRSPPELHILSQPGRIRKNGDSASCYIPVCPYASGATGLDRAFRRPRRGSRRRRRGRCARVRQRAAEPVRVRRFRTVAENPALERFPDLIPILPVANHRGFWNAAPVVEHAVQHDVVEVGASDASTSREAVCTERTPGRPGVGRD
jgi:hypothetical protein